MQPRHIQRDDKDLPGDATFPSAPHGTRVRGFSGIQIAALSFVLLLLTTIPVWTHSLPPLADYINHLARMHVIAAMGKDTSLSAYYSIQWQIIPTRRSVLHSGQLHAHHVRDPGSQS